MRPTLHLHRNIVVSVGIEPTLSHSIDGTSPIRQLTILEKICGVAPLPLQPKDFAQNDFTRSVLFQIANNTFLSAYPCSQDRTRTCMIKYWPL